MSLATVFKPLDLMKELAPRRDIPLRRKFLLYDGKNGALATIACQGKVYDVIKSFIWKDGRNQATHLAGQDLTTAMSDASYSDDLLERLAAVGVLVWG
jgi:predicted heme/steroid binding protein